MRCYDTPFVFHLTRHDVPLSPCNYSLFLDGYVLDKINQMCKIKKQFDIKKEKIRQDYFFS
jgi:hypothetical protein